MGVFANVGVSISVQDTLPKNRGDLGTLTDEIASWSHTSAAVGGYLSASCTVVTSLNVIDEWLESGLGRWLTLYDEGGNVCWRGFVEQIDANVGGVRITRGPLSSIANRALSVFSTINNSTIPPTVGVRDRTPIANHTASQALHGVWQKVLSCSGSTMIDATQQNAMFLQENAYPETTKTISPGGGGLSMTLTLKGTWYWLGAFIANFIGTPDTLNLSTRLIAILALDPNALFSGDVSNITANTYQVKYQSDDDKPGIKYINELLAPGDTTFNRYTAGFFGNEVFYYVPMPSVLESVYSISDPAQEILYQGGVVIRPWAVQPARWTQISDMMVGRVPDVNMRADIRNIFAETVNYTAPYGLVLNGAKVSMLNQFLAQKGLSGIGVG
jgi:hypothetical protein